VILALVEHQEGRIRKPALEAVSQSQRMANQLSMKFSIAIVGHQIASLTNAFAGFGVDKVYGVDTPELAAYSGEGYASAFAEIVNRVKPDWVFVGASAFGRDVAPRLAAKVAGGLVSDCTAMEVKDGDLLLTRPIYAGKALARVKVVRKPGIVTLRPNVFPALSSNGGGSPAVEKIAAALGSIRAKVVGTKLAQLGKLELTEANIIVSGGRGLKAPEHFHLVEDLAAALGAAVGASRAVVDAGWRPHEYQVGQTGKTVSPQLYIACGISGAIQHLAGMSSSKYIIAINKDPDAPIFKIANLGVVGDVFEILPRLTEAVKKVKGGG